MIKGNSKDSFRWKNKINNFIKKKN